jgi:hypothetical protein
MRTTTLCDTLADLVRQGLVLRVPGGYQLKLPLQDASPPIPFPLSPPRDPQGNGNGKHSHLTVTDTALCSGGG